MKKRIQALIFALCCAASSFGQGGQVPPGLHEAMRKKLEGWGPHLKMLLKSNGLDTTIQVAEIDCGTPVQIYYFRNWDKPHHLDSISVDAPVMSIVEPSGHWEFSLRARGQYLIGVKFFDKDGTWDWVSAGGTKTAWAEMRKVYPESSGVHPIIVYHAHRKYLHFPQKGEHNLTMLCDSAFRNSLKRELRDLKDAPGRAEELQETGQMLQATTDTYSVLVDSRRTLQYLKRPVGSQRRPHPSQGGRK